ncbi:MAG: RNA-guided endonuclease InsQ/TnpB family protein [Candidatus Njordarchaeia archaeon]
MKTSDILIRRSKLNINYANQGKLDTLDSLISESVRVVNLYIDIYWNYLLNGNCSKFSNVKVDTWLSARMQQCLGKQALAIIKSQQKKKIKIKPVFNKPVIELDERFVDIKFDENTFDIWIRLKSLGQRIQIKLPSKKHKHFLKYYENKKWQLKKSIRLYKGNKNRFFIDVFFECEKPELKQFGEAVGIDIGYKKLLALSNGTCLGETLEKVYEKISRKKQNSKAYKKALQERDNIINRELNKLKLNTIALIVVELLKNVKKNKHKEKKISRKFMNKLQRWCYSKVLDKLQRLCEETGTELRFINPAYTSQRCSKCGVICKSNRKGEIHKCSCGNIMDADINAARNILHLGVYSP